MYKNEAAKKAIKSHFKLSFQAKLWNSNHRPEHVRPDLEATLKDLGVRLSKATQK